MQSQWKPAMRNISLRRRLRVDQVGGVTQVLDQMGELLLGAVSRHDLVVAQEVRGVRFLLQLVAVPRVTHADFRLGGIAGLPDAGFGGHVLPGPGHVGENPVQLVESVGIAVLGRELAGFDHADDRAGRGDVTEKFFVKMFASTDQKVRKLLATDVCHTKSKCSCINAQVSVWSLLARLDP